MNNIIDLTPSSPSDVQASNWKSWPMALEDAIKTAEPHRLRKTLSVLCRNLPDAAKSTAFLLLVSNDMVKRKPKLKNNAGVDGQKIEQSINGEFLAKSLNEDHDEDETHDGEEDHAEDKTQDDDEDDEDDENDEDNEDDEEADEPKVAAYHKNYRKDTGEEGKEGKQEGGKYAEVPIKKDVRGVEGSHNPTAILRGKKRWRSKYSLCSNCEQEFDVTYNGKKACRWHDGTLEADEEGDFWADHDEDRHGIIDSYELQEDYPEGYKYDCCGQQNKTPGCSIGRHVETKESFSKRRRL